MHQKWRRKKSIVYIVCSTLFPAWPLISLSTLEKCIIFPKIIEHKNTIYYDPLFNCFSLFQVLIGQKSITWHKVFSANDRWWRFAGHYSIEPTGHYLRARVLWILYCKLGLRVQNPGIRTASCARFLIVACWANGSER